MKKLIAMLLALVMILSLCACNKKDDAADEEVTVKMLSEMVMTRTDEDGKTYVTKGILEYDDDYNVIGTKSYEDDKLVFEVTFDKAIDKPLLELRYDDNGKEDDRTEYVYDGNGNLLERSSSSIDDEGNPSTYKEVYTYDDKGNTLTEKEYRDGELEVETTYTYTASGKVATEVRTRDSQEDKTTYTYDEHDNLLSIKSVHDYGEGEPYVYEVTYENTYENGKLTEVKSYDDGELDGYVKYDADGNEVLNISYFDGDEYSRTESTYENGNLVKCVRKWGDGTSTYTYSYNADGKVTERSYTSSYGENERMSFSYDDDGLVTGMKMYNGDKLTLEYMVICKEVSVSKAEAEKLEAVWDELDLFGF